jgi:ribosomal protein S18 acetylase RimI-like enzyme
MVDQFQVRNTEMAELGQIFDLFGQSIVYQEEKGFPVWRNYDRSSIVNDIENRNQYAVVLGSTLAIVFSVGLADRVIWRELDKGDSLYLHRIVVNPKFKGQRLFGKILGWAKIHCQQKGLHTIRMDTWADNPTILSYYKAFGFIVIENYTTPDSIDLPVHNRNLALTLLEYRPDGL